MMNNRLTNDAKAVLQYAQEAAQKFHHDYVGTEHILLGLVLNTDGIAGLLLNQLGLTPENVTRAIEQHVGWGQDSPTKLRLTPRTKRAMELAVREANRLEQNYVGTEHMLAGILEEGSGMAVQILEDMDIDPDLVSQRLSELMNDPAVEGGDAVPSKNGSDLSQFGRDLNEWAKQGKIDPVIGREKEISRVIQILSRRTKNNPVLIGAPGVGKTAIAEGWPSASSLAMCPTACWTSAFSPSIWPVSSPVPSTVVNLKNGSSASSTQSNRTTRSSSSSTKSISSSGWCRRRCHGCGQHPQTGPGPWRFAVHRRHDYRRI